MKKTILTILFVLAFVLSACGSALASKRRTGATASQVTG